MTHAGAAMEEELHSQPEIWERAIELAAASSGLPQHGERVAVIGCGTSWFMAKSYAAAREDTGHGVTDAYAASEARLGRDYDRVVAITRSGTTSEVLEALSGLQGQARTVRTVGIVGPSGTPLEPLVDDLIEMPFADERSVVQTRFATSALTLLLAGLGLDQSDVVRDGRAALELELPEAAVAAEQLTFLGLGASTGLAEEAALKCREAAQAWTESYQAMEYRHGPIAIAQPGRATWMFGSAPEGLADSVRDLGADWVNHDLAPIAELVLAQRVALERSRRAGLDADSPRGLTRSVILTD
ncbi:MAG: SIS domain-containing protein [Actinomycetia bacterium]|nr:SIS domain-containing protein [Actinomycetes bacterium]